jgi:Cu/Ag efflux pump CusA
MTTSAMIAGMVPMALGFGEGGDQTAPLGRAVIGGLLASTSFVLLVLPIVFSIIQQKAGTKSSSVHPKHVLPATAIVDQENP